MVRFVLSEFYHDCSIFSDRGEICAQFFKIVVDRDTTLHIKINGKNDVILFLIWNRIFFYIESCATREVTVEGLLYIVML